MPSTEKKQQHVLVVDDDPYILMSLEFLMQKAGFGVWVARNGQEALAIVEKNTPEAVILDIMMPDVDGYQICQHIRKTKKLQHTKVIFLSAKSSEADVQKGMSVGADLYLTKPFSTRDLVKKITALLQA